MLRTILVPLDGSPLAETALEPAMLLARRFSAELLLVHTLYPDEPAGHAEDPQFYLDALASNLRSEGVMARTSLLPLEAVEGIVDEAAYNDVDLIVMTPRARKGLDALLHPSVTWQVLRQANAPILACKVSRKDDPAASIKFMPRFMTDPQAPILAPLDGSLQAESALPLARELAREFGNPLLLVSAQEQPLPTFPYGATWGPPVGVADDAQLITRAAQQAEEQARRYLEGKRAELASAGVRAQIEVGPGPATAFIEDIARERQAGLVVLASHGRGWLGRLMLGSVAQKLLRDLEMPMLLVRRQPASEAGQPPDQPAATEQRGAPPHPAGG
jgi:nucleotide-binding universal stress UspA family protein